MKNTRALAVLAAFIVCLYARNRNYRGGSALKVVLLVKIQLLLLSLTTTSLRHSVHEAFISTSLFIGVVIATTLLYRISPFHPLWRFPGPFHYRLTNLAILHMVYTGKRHTTVAEYHAKYGPIVRMGPNKLSINDLRAQQPVYSSASCMDKSLAYRPAHSFDGGLFFIRDRIKHNERRRLWSGAFSATSLSSWYDVLDTRTAQFISIAVKQEVVDLSVMVQRWSYDVMGDLTFGQSHGFELMRDGDGDKVVDNGETAMVLFEIFGEVPPLLDVVWYLPFSKEMHSLLRFAGKKLQELKDAKRSSSDILSHLVKGDGMEDNMLTDEELVLDTVFAIQAGSDTTAGVLILLLFYLLSDRRVYDKLTAELDEASKEGKPMDIGNLHRLPYLHAVVQEGIRLGTPFPGLPRLVPPGGTVLVDTYIPGGTIVGIPAYSQQVSPTNFFPSPLEFLPERWLPGGLGPNSICNANAVMCFSTGPFACLGKALAIRELHVFVARLLLSCHVELTPKFNGDAFLDGVKNMRTTVFTKPLTVTAKARS